MSTPDIVVINPHGRLLNVITEPSIEKMFNISSPVPKCPHLVIRPTPALIVMKEEPKKRYGLCKFEGGCNKIASFGNPTTRKRERCGTHKKPDMVNLNAKLCEYPGCPTRASFNLVGEATARYCASHMEEEMINVKSSKCKFPGCPTVSGFNLPGETKALYCATHKSPGMVDVKHRKCAEPNCPTIARFNLPSESRGLFCAIHQKDGMINVGDQKCAETGCLTLPTFNIPNSNRPLYCVEHKKPGMIDVKNVTCLDPNCRKRPNFNVPGETKGIYCSEHKKPNMIDVTHERCREPECPSIPNFNLPDELRGVYCEKHKLPNMVNVVSKKCEAPDCLTQAHCGKLFGPKIHCAIHKSKNEYAKNHPKCSVIDCPERPLYTDIGDNYPLRCEPHRLPQDKNVIERPCSSCKLLNFINEATMMCNDCSEFFVGKNNRGEKERRVREVIETQVHKPLGLKWLVTDRPIPNGCSKRRPDGATDYTPLVAITEVDENQHRTYARECELARMATIHQDLGGIPVIFIRYNPDSYKINGVTARTKKNREQVLVRLMHDLKNVKAVKYALLVCYLFYDEFDENSRTIKFSSIDYTKNPIEIKEVTDMFE